MEKVTGRVLSISPAAGQREVVIDVDARAVCRRCAEGKGCGAGVFGSSGRPQQMRALVGGQVDVSVGQVVEVSMQSGSLLKVAGTVYGLPLAGALAGAAVAWGLDYGDAGAAALGLVGLATGFLAARKHVRSGSCLRYARPVVTAVSGQT